MHFMLGSGTLDKYLQPMHLSLGNTFYAQMSSWTKFSQCPIEKWYIPWAEMLGLYKLKEMYIVSVP